MRIFCTHQQIIVVATTVLPERLRRHQDLICSMKEEAVERHALLHDYMWNVVLTDNDFALRVQAQRNSVRGHHDRTVEIVVLWDVMLGSMMHRSVVNWGMMHWNGMCKVGVLRDETVVHRGMLRSHRDRLMEVGDLMSLVGKRSVMRRREQRQILFHHRIVLGRIKIGDGLIDGSVVHHFRVNERNML